LDIVILVININLKQQKGLQFP